jgi:hypothetical protein
VKPLLRFSVVVLCGSWRSLSDLCGLDFVIGKVFEPQRSLRLRQDPRRKSKSEAKWIRLASIVSILKEILLRQQL